MRRAMALAALFLVSASLYAFRSTGSAGGQAAAEVPPPNPIVVSYEQAMITVPQTIFELD